MDFIERLKDSVNQIENLPIKCVLGYLKPTESLVIYPLAGSKVEREFFDGVKDQALNYEFAMKSKDQEKIQAGLWLIQNYLEELDSLTSNDGSFEFREIYITNKPYINSGDDQGFYIFQIDIMASITTFPKGGK